MAKKSAQPVAQKPAAAVPATGSVVTPTTPSVKPASQSATLSARSSPQEIAIHVWNKYLDETPTRTKLLDVFMGFLVLVGAVQFIYCILAGNYPFNAFLSGFSAAVGQFVLTASLRMQTSERTSSATAGKKPATKTMNGVTAETIETGKGDISSERAFADFVFGSLILHAFCINFIN